MWFHFMLPTAKPYFHLLTNFFPFCTQLFIFVPRVLSKAELSSIISKTRYVLSVFLNVWYYWIFFPAYLPLHHMVFNSGILNMLTVHSCFFSDYISCWILIPSYYLLLHFGITKAWVTEIYFYHLLERLLFH